MQITNSDSLISTFYKSLPTRFTRKQAGDLGYSARSTNRWLNQLVESNDLMRVHRGDYTKTDTSLDDEFLNRLLEEEKEKESSKVEQDINLKDGTGKFVAESSYEPRTPDQIYEVLKIDKSQWRLDRYWNKEKSSGKWLISALVSRVNQTPADILAEVIKNFKPSYIPFIPAPHININFDEPVTAVISTQDIHFGKEGNEDIGVRFKKCLEDLTRRAYMSHRIEKLYFVVGGDMLNMDTFSGTTTGGTPVDNCEKATQAYTKAFETMYWAIGFLKQFCKELVVVYMPGNHDRLSSFHLAHALSKCFENQGITWDINYAERKVHTYGINFFGFEHGDVKSKNPVGLYATEFAEQWGQTRNRTVFSGHTHTKKTREVITENEIHGLSVKELPSLASTDYWHYHNKYTGNKKAGVIELYSRSLGKVSEFWHISSN